MGSIADTKFRSNRYARSGGGVSFEERPAQPSDFSASRGYPYAQDYADHRDFFDMMYPRWQQFADCFVMRRAVLSISGRQKVETRTFRASELEDYLDPGFVTVKNFAIPGSNSGSIPRGKWQLVNLSFRDEGNVYTEIDVSYQQYGSWELIRLDDSVSPPQSAIEV